jgi:hypothetical protein
MLSGLEPENPQRASHAASAKASPARKVTPARTAPQAAPHAKDVRQGSQTEEVLHLLKRPGGANLKEIMKATGWQAHSV